jgi:ABC-2 type transport system ATP-binding protein
MIEVEGLTRRFGEVTAIDAVSLRVEKGEVLGFLGPNGAGKTTTMKILTCFLPPSEGTARVAGYDILTHPIEVRRRIGYLPENVPLYREMRVREYLGFVAAMKGVPARERPARFERVREETGLAGVEDRIIGKLSKGYRQRVGLAQALVHDPEVLILDEPTEGLDPRQILEVRELIKRLAGNHTVILSTHILPEVSQICRRIVIINRGRIVAEGSPEMLEARLQGSEEIRVRVRGPREEVEAFLGAIPGVTSVRAKDAAGTDGAPSAPDGIGEFLVASAPGEDLREEVARRIVGRSWGLLELGTLGMSLEEIFLKLTTREGGAE